MFVVPSLISLASNTILLIATERETSGDQFIWDLDHLMDQLPITLIDDIFIASIIAYFQSITGDRLTDNIKYSPLYVKYLNIARLALKDNHHPSNCRFNFDTTTCLCINKPTLIYNRTLAFVNILSLDKVITMHQCLKRMTGLRRDIFIKEITECHVEGLCITRVELMP